MQNMADDDETADQPRELMSQDVSVSGHDLFPGHSSGAAVFQTASPGCPAAVKRDKISFVGVAHLTRGGRSCSWALYR